MQCFYSSFKNCNLIFNIVVISTTSSHKYQTTRRLINVHFLIDCLMFVLATTFPRCRRLQTERIRIFNVKIFDTVRCYVVFDDYFCWEFLQVSAESLLWTTPVYDRPIYCGHCELVFTKWSCIYTLLLVVRPLWWQVPCWLGYWPLSNFVSPAVLSVHMYGMWCNHFLRSGHTLSSLLHV